MHTSTGSRTQHSNPGDFSNQRNRRNLSNRNRNRNHNRNLRRRQQRSPSALPRR